MPYTRLAYVSNHGRKPEAPKLLNLVRDAAGSQIRGATNSKSLKVCFDGNAPLVRRRGWRMLAQTPAVVTSRAAAVGLPIHPNVVLNSRGIRISCAALGNGAPRLEAVHPRRK
jgi:hypothetical protein